ncbi:MAG TPA: hypothetical protein PLG09_06215 [Syntrophomonadaceae bacterium]|nr:hypothetical protein [Syntrophomonadaceae bacterium]HOQ09702.1 hypothetical protein [Syntrophomonadaceae bacterium]
MKARPRRQVFPFFLSPAAGGVPGGKDTVWIGRAVWPLLLHFYKIRLHVLNQEAAIW